MNRLLDTRFYSPVRLPVNSAVRTSMVAEWYMDETSGSRLDNSGNSYTLTQSGSAVSTTGVISNAVRLVRSSSQYLTRANNSDLQINSSTAGWTIEFWLRLNSKPVGSSVMPIFYKSNAASLRELEVRWTESSDRVTAIVYNGVSTARATLNATSAGNAGVLSLSTWYQFFVWWNPFNAKSNGTLNIQSNMGTVSTTSLSGAPASSTSALYLGYDTSRYLDGDLDNVRIWRRVLSGAERQHLYNNGSSRLI